MISTVQENWHQVVKRLYGCLYLARIGRPDVLWTVNILARSVTKWINACDKRLARLIRYIKHNITLSDNTVVGDEILDCKVGLFQDASFARDLQDSTSGGVLRVFGPQTCVSIPRLCKKQTDVSHSSAESDNIFVGLMFENGRKTQHCHHGTWFLEACSHPGDTGNLTRPSGKRHSLSLSLSSC